MITKILRSIKYNKTLTVTGIIVVTLFLMYTSVKDEAPIVDEIPHIGAGYSYIAKGDHRLNPEHPPLAKDLAGLGVLLSGPTDKVFQTRFWTDDINGQWEFGRFLIFNSGSDTDKMITLAKLPMFIFFVLLAVLIYVWASKLYGFWAGLIALFLFSFSPTIIAHSRFVTTDVPALFGVVLSSFFFFKYLDKPTLRNFILAGIMFGVAQLTKYSLVLLIPFFVLLGVIFGFVNPVKQKLRSRFSGAFDYGFSTIIIIAIGYIFVVWPYYIPHIWNEPPQVQKHQTQTILETFGRRELAEPVIYFSDKPVFRALSQYGLGLLMVIQRSVGGNDTYFMGEFSNQSWKSYFPIVYLLKEPLPFWILLLTILGFYSVKWKSSALPLPKGSSFSKSWDYILDWIKKHFVEFAMLLWILIYWYTSIQANLNIGVRHIMPTFGFVFILMAGRLMAITKRIRRPKNLKIYFSILGLLLGWYLVENLKVFPYYLTYFNQIAGGPSGGYRYVVDSNVDWGQDLKRLTHWVEENDIQKIHLDYFGWSDQTYYLKEKLVWIGSERYRSKADFLKENPSGGYIAVSATFYMGLSHRPGKDYFWLPLEERLTTIGNSIFIWEIRP